MWSSGDTYSRFDANQQQKNRQKAYSSTGLAAVLKLV